MPTERFLLLGLLEKGECHPDDDALFAECIRESMRVLDLSFLQLATLFSMSLPSVKRWTSGMTAPHPSMRAPVYQTLQNVLLGVRQV